MTPDEFTNQELMIDVSDGHTLYVHDWGKSDAETPILFLHGGPGGQSKDKHKQQFDPGRQRVIFFDQRGGGKSLPYGSLDNNTTQHMIADMAEILEHFQIEQCIIVGGSWGSALAFYFALEHPERVKAMVLDGVFTGSQTEIDWLDQGKFRNFYPDAWDNYFTSVPKSQQQDPSRYHFERILGDDPIASKESSFAYETLEGAVLKLDDRTMPENYEEYDPSGIRIEVHYLSHGCFVPDNYVLENAARLTMPIWLIQGRYDMVCPPETAYKLNKLLQKSELIWTTSGHHSERETWNVKRLLLLQLAK